MKSEFFLILPNYDCYGDLRVGALGGLGGGEGVLVKGSEGKEGKDGKEKVNGFGPVVIGLNVVNGGW